MKFARQRSAALVHLKLTVALLLLASTSAALAAELIGQASVIDGDTLKSTARV